MALVTVTDSGGTTHLMHTSIFDSHRPARLLGDWKDVWARIDGMTPYYFDARTNHLYTGRNVIIDELTRQVLDQMHYGPKALAWLAKANLTHDADRGRIIARRFIRAEVAKLWRHYVRFGNGAP